MDKQLFRFSKNAPKRLRRIRKAAYSEKLWVDTFGVLFRHKPEWFEKVPEQEARPVLDPSPTQDEVKEQIDRIIRPDMDNSNLLPSLVSECLHIMIDFSRMQQEQIDHLRQELNAVKDGSYGIK